MSIQVIIYAYFYDFLYFNLSTNSNNQERDFNSL